MGLCCRNAQVSLELLILIGMLLLFFAAVIQVRAVKVQEARALQAEGEAWKILLEVSQVMNTVVVLGEGARKELFLPDTVGGFDYAIAYDSFNYRYVSLSWNEADLSVPVITTRIFGSLNKGKNVVKFEDGAVVIE